MSTQKVVLVTGASSGFGAMTVRALADAKHVVTRAYGTSAAEMPKPPRRSAAMPPSTA
jgi:NAD(P)-dependent dehydrogenase (short-subunit alcohol dehydrogenase family)